MLLLLFPNVQFRSEALESGFSWAVDGSRSFVPHLGAVVTSSPSSLPSQTHTPKANLGILLLPLRGEFTLRATWCSRKTESIPARRQILSVVPPLWCFIHLHAKPCAGRWVGITMVERGCTKKPSLVLFPLAILTEHTPDSKALV